MKTDGPAPNRPGAPLPWTLFGIVFLILVWEAASRAYGSGLILPGPVPVLKRLLALVTTRRFLAALGGSFLRVMAGILIAVPVGIAAGIGAGLDPRVRAFLSPLFSVISATPVMSVILIAFLFLGSGRTPVFTAFLMVFPVMAANVTAGMARVDPRLKELFTAFKMSRRETVRFLYIPSLVPFISGGLRSSLSLCWKVVVASEVMVQPLRSLGAGMQEARAQLETPDLFAWTIAAVLAASFSQGILSLAARFAAGRSFGGGSRKEKTK